VATSTHFKELELACRCGCKLDNVKLELLAKLEQLRVIIRHPIILTSASRCPARELAVSGKSGGAHTTGDAVDIKCTSDLDRFNLIRILLELGFCRIGVAADFIHADLSETLPQAVCWTYGDKK